MKDYNYHHEIATNLKMFTAAFDETVIRRFEDTTKTLRDYIKVNYVYGPKSRIYAELFGKTDNFVYPIVAISPTGFSLDKERLKNKLQDIIYKDEQGNFINLRGIPWNISIEMRILAKYQSDIDQIVTNFAAVTVPYIVYSWREPMSGKEVRAEALWDGNISLSYPDELPPNQEFKLVATATFTIKTYLYRTVLAPVKSICHIHTDYVITDNFYCNYESLTANTQDNQKESFDIEGRPNVRYVAPYSLNVGDTPTIKIQGESYDGTYALFLSGSNPDMYPLSHYDPFSGSNTFPSFYGYSIPEFNIHNSCELTFALPAPSAYGLVDIIAVNSCGYGKLTVDANRCSRVSNPYPPHMPEHYSWCVLQFPFINGLMVSDNLNPETEICEDGQIIEFVDGPSREDLIDKIRELMELGNITVNDLA